MFFNLSYNILIILILKFGSSNILWMAPTVAVPLGDIAFSLPFVPQSAPMNGERASAAKQNLFLFLINVFIFFFL